MLDRITITVSGGAGGHGLTSFHREKFQPKGGPDGGDGGRGGRVYLRAVDDVYTLEQYRAKRKFRAGNGGNGAAALRTGAVGNDITLDVPTGTVVLDAETGDLIADLNHPGDTELVAHGGRGGWGNKRFASSTNQAPNFSQKGHDGETLEVTLELRMLADVGLLGLPNAGKSTFLATVSNAKPKIADYPFTTLEPMLGVVNVGFTRFTIADLPGLIEGASEGLGLGFEFLKHVRRCRVLLHVVDSTSPDSVTDYELIEGEVRAFDPELERIPRRIAVTKADEDEAGAAASAKALAAHTGAKVHVISALDERGVPELLEDLMAAVKAERERIEAEEAATLPVLRPESRERFAVTEEGPGRYRVEGFRVTNFVEMMDTGMEGARAEVERRLERWGVSKALRRAGIQPQDIVCFGETEIVWDAVE
jgi:GTPase